MSRRKKKSSRYTFFYKRIIFNNLSSRYQEQTKAFPYSILSKRSVFTLIKGELSNKPQLRTYADSSAFSVSLCSWSLGVSLRKWIWPTRRSSTLVTLAS